MGVGDSVGTGRILKERGRGRTTSDMVTELERSTHTPMVHRIHLYVSCPGLCFVLAVDRCSPDMTGTKTFNTLLVDIHSGISSTAAASGNITRCALSAGGVAAMQPLLHILSRGWYFTLVGCLSGIGGGLNVYMIKSCGQRWRHERERKHARELESSDQVSSAT
jgi:hypothetical protein